MIGLSRAVGRPAVARCAALRPGAYGLMQARTFLSASQPKRRGTPQITPTAPLPPPEFEADGSPRRYPLHGAVQDHGYDWEHWSIMPAGCFHTIYWGDLAADYKPSQAWLQSIPLWCGAPVVVFCCILLVNLLQKSGNIGIKPKRYTIEWVRATKERERVENTNPVTRYLDRRYAERGYHVPLGDIMPYNAYFFWMYDSHDWDYIEEKGLPDPRETADWKSRHPN
eukprot:gene148-167_t